MTGGQDRGARFGLRGTSATLGRGPTVDVMLTDPEVAAEHARLSVSGGRLRLEDLGTGAPTRVNGAPLRGAAPLSLGDRVQVGATELTVRWTPGAPAGRRPGWPEPAAPAPAPPPPPVAAPAAARPSPPPAPPRPAAVPSPPTGGRGLPAAVLGLALLGLAAASAPVLGDGAGGRSLWSIGSAGLRGLALAAVLVAGAAGLAGLAAAAGRPRRMPPGAEPVAAASAGGALLGIALLLGTADAGAGPRAGVLLIATAGLGLVGVAGALAVALAGGVAGEGRTDAAVVAAGASAGGAMAAVAPFLVWLERGVYRLSGFDAGVLTARALLPLALATIGAGVMAPVATARAGRREGALAAVTACALGAAVAAFGVTAAAVHRPVTLGPGVGLTVAGGVVALIPAVAGTLGLVAPRRGL